MRNGLRTIPRLTFICEFLVAGCLLCFSQKIVDFLCILLSSYLCFLTGAVETRFVH